MLNTSNIVSKVLPYWKLIRPINCIIGGLSLVVATIVVLNVDVLVENFYLVFIGALIMWLVSAGGFVVNDIVDIEIDRINTPHRVLPSGQMSLRTAYIFSIVLFLLAFILSVYSMSIPTDLNLGIIPPLFTLFGIISLIIYAVWLKKMGFLGNILIAILAVVPFVIGGIVLDDISRGVLPVLIVLSLIYSREIIKDILDVKGDTEASGSFYSLPALIGIKNTVWLARISLIILVLSCFSPLYIGLFSFYKSFSIIGLGIIYLIFSVRIFYLLRGDNETIIENAREGKSLLKIAILIGLLGLGLNPFTSI